MGLTLRLSLDEMIGALGFAHAEVRDFIAMHEDLPDLWDLAHGTWEDCSGPSRFTEEAAQKELVAGIKSLTSRPVVGVGRFTSPDVMVQHVRSGTLDFIGCARPSIADPFLPRKIEQGRVDDIRECIGCNVCITGDMTMSISRCTQNPTFMEEWRKGWHPPPRAHRSEELGRARARRRRGARGTRGPRAPAPSAATRSCSPRPTSRSVGGCAASARCRVCPHGGAWRTTASTSSRRRPTSRPTSTTRSPPTRCSSSASPTCASRRARAGAATACRGSTSCRCRSMRRCRCSRPTT